MAAATADLDVRQLVSGVAPEVSGFHNMLVPMLSCPDATDPPATGQLPSSFFRCVIAVSYTYEQCLLVAGVFGGTIKGSRFTHMHTRSYI